MTSLCSTAAPDCCTGQTKGRYRARPIPVVVIACDHLNFFHISALISAFIIYDGIFHQKFDFSFNSCCCVRWKSAPQNIINLLKNGAFSCKNRFWSNIFSAPTETFGKVIEEIKIVRRSPVIFWIQVSHQSLKASSKYVWLNWTVPRKLERFMYFCILQSNTIWNINN